MYKSHQFRPEIIDTEPGASSLCPFSPPPDFQGAGEEYIEMMRRRFRSIEHGRYLKARIQHFAEGGELKIIGRFSAEAANILGRLAARNPELKKAG